MKVKTIAPTLGKVDLTFIVIGLVIGMGIFRTPAEVAHTAGQPWVFYAAWIAGGMVSMIGAFIFSEIGGRHPRAGGFYELFSHCYHPAFAFMVNWITVISNAASSALVALIGSDYVAPLLFPHTPNARIYIALTSTLLLFGVNWSGMKIGSRLLNALMMLKIGLMVLVIASIFFVPEAPPSATTLGEGMPWYAFLLCFTPVFFTYGGYQQTMNFGGDAQQASRLLPRAIITGMLIVLVLYLSIGFAYHHALGFEGLANTSTPAADVVGILLGGRAQLVFSGFMFFGVMAYVNVSMMSNPRVYYAMAKDGVMPAAFGHVNPKTQTQEIPLLLFTAIILITLFFASSIESLLQYVMFFDSIAFITGAGAIFIFRARAKRNEEAGAARYAGFRAWGYPVLPACFILIYGAIIATIFASKQQTAWIGLALFSCGLPLFYLLRKIIRHPHD
ncbi:MAG: APC family permease, partial [Flavobacteriales bacterium]